MFTHHQILMYFLMTLGATGAGLMFSLVVENWSESRYKYIYAAAASILLTPFGAWAISTVMRYRRLKKKFSEQT